MVTGLLILFLLLCVALLLNLKKAEILYFLLVYFGTIHIFVHVCDLNYVLVLKKCNMQSMCKMIRTIIL